MGVYTQYKSRASRLDSGFKHSLFDGSGLDLTSELHEKLTNEGVDFCKMKSQIVYIDGELYVSKKIKLKTCWKSLDKKFPWDEIIKEIKTKYILSHKIPYFGGFNGIVVYDPDTLMPMGQFVFEFHQGSIKKSFTIEGDIYVKENKR